MNRVREYTLLAPLGAAAVVVLEVAVLRTGLFRTRAYWIAMAICYAFMIAVNGWLTKLSAPVVLYNPDEAWGRRIPWDIPVEDYVFGFALLTLTMLLWDAAGERKRARMDGSGGSADRRHEKAGQRLRRADRTEEETAEPVPPPSIR